MKFREWLGHSLAFFSLFAGYAHALNPPGNNHWEITPAYNTTSTTWTWTAVASTSVPLSSIFFAGSNITGGGGTIVTRPIGTQWDFLGIPSGSTFWRFNGTAFFTPGFAATPSNMAGNPLNYRLHSVIGPAGGMVALYFSNSNPIPYFRTDNGINSTDLYPKPDNHEHMNWAFTKKGLWIVNLTVQGTFSGGATSPVSSPQPIAFAIGDYARWTATRFSMVELLDANTTSDSCDPDGDGWNQLLEYALGGEPLISSSLRSSDGQAMAPQLILPPTAGNTWKFRYFRRKPSVPNEPIDVTYVVESSTTLAENTWLPEMGTAQIISSTAEWDCVQVDVAPATSGNAKFTRLKVIRNP